jgi:DNA-binding transcriptional LysR family regulator
VGVSACAVYRRFGSGSDAWVTYAEEQAHYATARWVQRRIEETGGVIALRASSGAMQLAAMRAGRGRGVLPCYAADDDPLLERLTAPVPKIAAEHSVIVHRDLRRAVCVRAVIDWVRRAFAEQRDAVAGTR